MKKKNTRLAIVLNCVMGILWLLPIYWSFVTSTKTQKEIYGGITLYPHRFTWENYVDLFSYRSGVAYGYLWNSIRLCLLTILIVSTVSVLAGYAFSRLELIGKKLWLTLVLLAMMVPVQALMVPLHNTLASTGLLGTVWGMVAVYVTFQTPFCVYMMKSTFDSVPMELQEAALVDGAGSFTIFRKIYLPLTIPGMITIVVYSAYTTWNDYTISLTFGGNTMKTFNVGLVDMLSNDSAVNWGMLTSGSIVGIIPIVILFLFLQKYFVKGMMSGAVK